jgi:uncharacterized SAM-binding protein YcdF (DUF218 family)
MKLRLIVLTVVVLLAYPVWLGYQVWSQSHRDENHTADAIVVLGAAQYDGDPSPIFEARLKQAVYLYDEGFSDSLIVTGGKQPGDRFTEAGAGEAYLVAQGVPAEAITQEDNGRTTLQSLREVRRMADDLGLQSVVLVSDPMHSERLKRIAIDLGFEDAYTSPASYITLNRSRLTKARELVREVMSIIYYELS